MFVASRVGRTSIRFYSVFALSGIKMEHCFICGGLVREGIGSDIFSLMIVKSDRMSMDVRAAPIKGYKKLP